LDGLFPILTLGADHKLIANCRRRGARQIGTLPDQSDSLGTSVHPPLKPPSINIHDGCDLKPPSIYIQGGRVSFVYLSTTPSLVMIPYLLLVSLATAVRGVTVTQQWELAANNIAPDGFKRSASLVNGVFPGPLLSASKGDDIQVNLTNSLFDPNMRRSTSIVR
jgi:Multicopper oxidase